MARVYKEAGWYGIDYVDAEGRRHRHRVAKTKRVAREILNNTIDKVVRGVHLGVFEDSNITFGDFADLWLARVEHTIKPRTRERWNDALKHLKPHFSSMLRSITAAVAEGYVQARLKAGAKPSTVNREMTVLKQLMRRAVAWSDKAGNHYLGRNPFLDAQGNLVEGLKPLKEPPGRTRFLDADEIDRLLAACERVPMLKPFSAVALNTGMRRNEILGLTRASIDWQNRIATLTDTKNGEPRHVYLNDAAFGALKALPVRLDGRLFTFGPNQVSVALKRAVRRAKIENFRLHDLRHTFASYHAMQGTQGRGLQDLLGHKDGRMTARYSHLSDAYLRGAVNRVQLGTTTAAKPDAAKSAS